MLDIKHQRKLTSLPLIPTFFAEDGVGSPLPSLCESPHLPKSSSPSTDLGTPKRRKPLRVDELDFATVSKLRKPAPGSVFRHARKLVAGGDTSSGTTDDSSINSDEVEVIVSELENLTQISDTSQTSTVRDDSSFLSSDSERFPDYASELQLAVTNMKARNLKISELREIARKRLFAEVRLKVGPGNSAIRQAVLSLVADVGERQEFLRVVDTTSEEYVFLLRTGGEIRGLYTLEKRVLFKLYGLNSVPNTLPESAVKRWFRWEQNTLKRVDHWQQAVVFDW